VRGERIKGKVGAWVAHIEALRAVRARMSKYDWSLVIEDDVRLAVPWNIVQEQLQLTICKNPHVDVVYLTGRDYSNREIPWEIPSYTGVDAYAVRSSAIDDIINLSLISYPHVRALALDAHWSYLVTSGQMKASLLQGGQVFCNRWKETVSDIEVSS
jgi:hypothetical protein